MDDDGEKEQIQLARVRPGVGAKSKREALSLVGRQEDPHATQRLSEWFISAGHCSGSSSVSPARGSRRRWRERGMVRGQWVCVEWSGPDVSHMADWHSEVESSSFP